MIVERIGRRAATGVVGSFNNREPTNVPEIQLIFGSWSCAWSPTMMRLRPSHLPIPVILQQLSQPTALSGADVGWRYE